MQCYVFVLGVFFAKSDVGLGTIVGSAVFNIFVIISVVALFSGQVNLPTNIYLCNKLIFLWLLQVIYLLWWPMTRDCLCYVLSILTLALVIMDNEVQWYEKNTELLEITQISGKLHEFKFSGTKLWHWLDSTSST